MQSKIIGIKVDRTTCVKTIMSRRMREGHRTEYCVYRFRSRTVTIYYSRNTTAIKETGGESSEKKG